MNRTRAGTRLTVNDWLDAGMRLIISEGIDALKVARLSTMLGVTKGSFYWHFTDIAAMKAALAHRCVEIHESIISQLDRLVTLTPRDRLDTMCEMLTDPVRWRAEAAVRQWAEVDPVVAKSVAHLDQQILRIAAETMHDIGFEETQARTRAAVLLYAGIGYLHAHERVGTVKNDDMRRVIDLITRP